MVNPTIHPLCNKALGSWGIFYNHAISFLKYDRASNQAQFVALDLPSETHQKSG